MFENTNSSFENTNSSFQIACWCCLIKWFSSGHFATFEIFSIIQEDNSLIHYKLGDLPDIILMTYSHLEEYYAIWHAAAKTEVEKNSGT